jgi:hypothetical protein
MGGWCCVEGMGDGDEGMGWWMWMEMWMEMWVEMWMEMWVEM